MNLRSIYDEEGYPGLRKLAKRAGCSPHYLYQCATGWEGRQVSARLAKRLVEADNRLDFNKLLNQ